MLMEQALELIRTGILAKPGSQTWADLGCGKGTFTWAMAGLLAKGSKIYAVDKNNSLLNRIPQNKDVAIEKLNIDFIKDNLPGDLDGILMANSFHYVNDKGSFIKNIEKKFKSVPVFLIVEYDMDISNPWVPYPLSFNSLRLFFENKGYASIKKLNEHPSIYRRANIYSAVIEKHA